MSSITSDSGRFQVHRIWPGTVEPKTKLRERWYDGDQLEVLTSQRNITEFDDWSR